VEWTFDPWTERPLPAGVAALAVLGMWLMIAWASLPALVALLLGAFSALPLLPAFVPASCRVGPAGAERRGLWVSARRSWADVRRIEDVPVGVLLSPYAERHWLDATRALTLPMPSAKRSQLRAAVREWWGRRERG
jgi:hypothetical protein